KIATAILWMGWFWLWTGWPSHMAGIVPPLSHPGSILENAINPLSGWVILFTIVLMYWSRKSKGQKPESSTGIDGQILSHFSFHGRRIFLLALQFAHQERSTFISLHHLIKALSSNAGFKIVLVRMGISFDELYGYAKIRQQDDLRQVLEHALGFAKDENSRISWDDLSRGIILGSQAIQPLLAERKITPEEAVAVVNWSKKTWYYKPPKIHSGLLYDLLTPKRNINKSWSARPTPTLDSFSRNLTHLARVGTLTSAKVRQEEVEEAIRILSRSEGNNLILVGESGVGKTSVVGDIALKMLDNQIPSLNDYRLVSLDVGAMLGSSVGFEKLFAKAAYEAALSGNTILFIGNLSQITKARTETGFDLSGILLSALKEGGLQMIATSDPVNYKKYVENNDNLRDYFSKVDIQEMDNEKATLVLEDQAGKIERRHGAMITLSAVKAAVDLSKKFIHTSKLPDKAEGLLDEAAVYASRRRQPIVTEDDIEAVLASKTNVPIGDLTESEKNKLRNLKAIIQRDFIGQEEAVDGVVEALKRARLGVSKADRPVGTFLFLGPTGVGKTELSKRLAEAYFGDESKMIRLDMSEYQTRESAYRLFGAPAVSGDIALSGGELTEAVKKTPFAVILLDEIEKAHPDIHNVFLQVLDEGKMTDNLGNTIDFTHTIIIATSNAQARFIQEAMREGMPYEEIKSQLQSKLIQENFTPEFVNRFDGVIMFKPLTKSEIKEIAHLKVAALSKRLKTAQDLDVEVPDEVVSKLAELGYDPAFGARPLERVIREKVEGKIAEVLLSSDTKPSRIVITVDDLS
ncbi:hypothetical protein A2V68_02205, partial [candidate division Kazan bacterium RBG_13_50_9]